MARESNTISELLHKAALLAGRNETVKAEARLRGESFNVYRTCGVDHYENTHSAILAEWLNPEGSHGQGDTFLQLFIQSALAEFSPSFDTRHASVVTEYATREGRLDILIEDPACKAIIVENKLYASDQSEQLRRYERFARSKYGDNGYRLLYLTLDGSEASEQSGKEVVYTPISYKKTLVIWLGACIKAVYDKPFIRESMIQYRNLIKQLTGLGMDKTVEKELVAEMLHNPDGVAAIINAQPVWEKTMIEESLFTPLRRFAKEHRMEFKVDDSFWTKNKYGGFRFEIKTNLSIVFEHEHRGWTNFYYGVVDKRPARKECKTLPGLKSGNDLWRYGWHYLDMHRDWTVEDVIAFSRDGGKFLRYICSAVDSLLEEMTSNQIL